LVLVGSGEEEERKAVLCLELESALLVPCLDATEAGSKIVEEEEGEDVYAVYNQHDDTPMAIPPTTPRTKVSVFMIVQKGAQKLEVAYLSTRYSPPLEQ
jgi:siroheme synthase (precorrin-2 oxidase/ferrochelatase)